MRESLDAAFASTAVPYSTRGLGRDVFERAFAFTIGHEGGFGKDPNDKGNWTGGLVGAGELKGTKFGISAAAYHHLDIENLTLADAKEIYLRDYWQRLRLESVEHAPLGVKLFDVAVNCGVGKAIELLQLAANYLLPVAVELEVDGRIGAKTIGAVNALRGDRITLALCGELYVWYRSLVESERTTRFEAYAGGWLMRCLWVPQL